MKNESALDTFLSSCRNTVKVTHGKRVYYVPCGKCPDCINRKSIRYTQQCIEESNSHRYTYFFTLTYNERNVPKVVLTNSVSFDNERVSTIRGYVCTPRLMAPNSPARSLDNMMYELRDSNIYEEEFKQFISRTKLEKYDIKAPTLRFVYKKDIQNFIKRLRFHSRKLYNAELRYFICSEYGPQTFRPHYHGLLFFDEPELVENIESLINKCWPFGFVSNPSFASVSSGCANYVASYCNSVAHLPRYLSFKHVRPFVVHSTYMGGKRNTLFRNYVYEDVKRANSSFVIQSNGNVWKYFPTSSNIGVLFPRPYNYESQNSYDLFKLYTAYRTFSEQTRVFKCSELTKHILCNHRSSSFRYYLQLLDLFQFESSDSTLVQLQSEDYYRDLFAFKTIDDFKDIDITVYSRVYSSLLLSKKFLSFNCEHYPPEVVFTKILDFYSNRSLAQLYRQYEMMQEYSNRFPNEDFSPFFPELGTNLAYKSHQSILFKNRDSFYSQHIKKKHLNDEFLQY